MAFIFFEKIFNKKHVLFACTILFAAVFLFKSRISLHKKSMSQTSNPLLLAYDYHKPARELDPARINNISECLLLDNLYSRLVEYNTKGEILPSIPESFEWQGDKLVFLFGNKVRTVDGYVVDANDAARSLKRAIFYEKTGHGDLRNFLCPGVKLKSIDDDCPGIKVSGNRLILTPTKKGLGSILLTMLENADFSIIPKSNLNANPRDPKIISHRNSSGPYYLAEDATSGAWELRANPSHYLFNEGMPNVVKLKPSNDAENSGKLFIEGKLDLIPTSMSLPGSQLKEILADTKNFNVHESIPIKVFMLAFSPSAIKRFSAEQRMFAAKVIEKFNRDFIISMGFKPTSEFLQPLSDGGLSESQRNEIDQLRKRDLRPEFREPIVLAVSSKFFEIWKERLKNYPEIRPMEVNDNAFERPVSERPDIYSVFSDAAWTESLSLLGHNFNVGIFQLPNVSGEEWIRKYLDIDDKKERITKLQDLHFALLKSAIIFPTGVGPYYVLAQKKWNLELSTLAAGTELWRIRRAR